MEQHLRKNGIVRMRNYGRIIQEMVRLATQEQDQTKQQAMIVYIAQCMRLKNAQWNKELESGNVRLKEDIHVLSHGALNCDFPAFDEAMQKLAYRVTYSYPNNPKKKRK